MNLKVCTSTLPSAFKKKLKQWKKQKKQGTINNSVLDTFKKEGIESLLYNQEELSNLMTHKVCQFTKQNNRFPKKGAKDPEEVQMSQWLNKKKRAIQGKGNGKFYESDQNIAQSYGLHDLFYYTTEKQSNDITCKVCQFIKQNNRLPTLKAKDQEEIQIAQWLYRKKQAKQGTTKQKFYESDQKIAESYGLHDLFNSLDLEKESNLMTHKVCKFLKANTKIPTTRAKDPEELQIANWINKRKGAKQGKKGKFYESDQKIAESYGLPNIFEFIRK